MNKLILVFLSFTIIFQACASLIRKQLDIYGSYHNSTDKHLEILELNDNKTFNYYYCNYNFFKESKETQMIIDSCNGTFTFDASEIYFNRDNDKSDCCNYIKNTFVAGNLDWILKTRIKNQNLLSIGGKKNQRKFKKVK